MNKQYTLITDIHSFNKAMQHLDEYEVIAFDTETTGLNVRKDKVIGFGFTGAEKIGFYFPKYKYRVDHNILEKFHWNFTPYSNPEKLFLDKLKTKNLVMHNASYDIRISYSSLKYNFLNALHADTVLMEHTLNEEGPFGLKDLAEKYKVELGFDDQDASNQEQLDLKDSVIANGGKWLKTQKDIYKGDWELIGTYCCADVDMTIRLYNFLSVRLKEENLEDFFYTHEVMPLYKLVTIRMESKGVCIDIPKLQKLQSEIKKDIERLETEVVIALLATEAGQQFAAERLAEEFPVSNKGAFAQEVVKLLDLPFPKLASGKYQITKKTIIDCRDLIELHDHSNVILDFLEGNPETTLYSSFIEEIQKRLLIAKEGTEHIINISSKQQLGRIVFDLMGIEPLTKTEKGAGQFNEDFIEHLAQMGMDWAKKLRVYNKLVKIEGSSFSRFLEEQEDGVFYPVFKQHATTSGRYSSNLQQLPRPMEDGDDDPLILKYNNEIRALFIPKEGYVYIDDDYASLEPVVFADDSEDQPLMDIFIKGEDFYSKVAIMALGLKNVSADKKAPNFLKNIYPKHRQDAKAYSLGIRYGAKAAKVAQLLGIELEEAEKLIQNYFKAFPNLKAKMDRYLKEAKTTGTVKSKFGRVRHLPELHKIYKLFKDDILDYKKLGLLAKKHNMQFQQIKDLRKTYNNLLNNALNFPIQSAATSIVSRAAIAITREFIDKKIDGWVSMVVHDQIIVTVKESQKQQAAEIVQRCMEKTNTLSVPLVAIPQFAYNMRDGH